MNNSNQNNNKNDEKPSSNNSSMIIQMPQMQNQQVINNNQGQQQDINQQQILQQQQQQYQQQQQQMGQQQQQQQINYQQQQQQQFQQQNVQQQQYQQGFPLQQQGQQQQINPQQQQFMQMMGQGAIFPQEPVLNPQFYQQQQAQQQQLIEETRHHHHYLNSRISDNKRKELKENPQNLELGGRYQRFLFWLGDCCGSIRAVCPCCCCVDYPYKTIDQSYQGVYERFGKYVKTVGSGLNYYNVCTDTIEVINCKTINLDLNKAWSVTNDNLLVSLDATVYYRITEPKKALYYLENVRTAVEQLTYATLRTIVGQYKMQELLDQKQKLAHQLEGFVRDYVEDWGVDISQIAIKDVTLNQDIAETLSAAARERRLAESKIINAKAEVQSAKLMREAADILDSKAAMQIRYLDTLSTLGKNSKVIFLGEEEEEQIKQKIQNQVLFQEEKDTTLQ